MEPAKLAVRAKGAKTRQAILDVAEDLFGRHAFDAVSLRDLADAAGVPVGLISYHFKGKEALFEEVAKRRSEQLNERRLGALTTLESPSLEQIVDAFLRPVVELLDHPEWHSYLQVMTKITTERRWGYIGGVLFADLSVQFRQALATAMPGLSKESLYRGYNHMLAVLIGAIQSDASARMLEAEGFSARSSERICATMIPFVVAGFSALEERDLTA
jgi:AcrR family transcriptional regulator